MFGSIWRSPPRSNPTRQCAFFGMLAVFAAFQSDVQGSARNPAITARLDRLFQFLGGTEGDLLLGLDLDLLPSRRIAPHPRGTLAYLKNTETAEPDAPPLLQMPSDSVDHASEHVIHLGFREAVAISQGRRKMANGDGLGLGSDLLHLLASAAVVLI